MEDALPPNSDATQKTLDTLADLFLTNTAPPEVATPPETASTPEAVSPPESVSGRAGPTPAGLTQQGVQHPANPPSATSHLPTAHITANEPPKPQLQPPLQPMKLAPKPVNQFQGNPLEPLTFPRAPQTADRHAGRANADQAPTAEIDPPRFNPPSEAAAKGSAPKGSAPEESAPAKSAPAKSAPAATTPRPASPRDRLPSDGPALTGVEALLLGNLPGLAGPWATQYAQTLADTLAERVLLIHADDETTALQLVRPASARGAHDAIDLPRHPGDVRAFVQRLLSQPIGENNPAARVLVRLDPDTHPQRLAQLTNWTLLSGADNLSITAAYQSLRRLAHHTQTDPQNAARHLQIVIAGCDQDRAAPAAQTLARSLADALAGHIIQPTGTLPRMAPARTQPLGSFPSKACGLDDLLTDLAGLTQPPEGFTPILLNPTPAPGSGHISGPAPGSSTAPGSGHISGPAPGSSPGSAPTPGSAPESAPANAPGNTFGNVPVSARPSGSREAEAAGGDGLAGETAPGETAPPSSSPASSPAAAAWAATTNAAPPPESPDPETSRQRAYRIPPQPRPTTPPSEKRGQTPFAASCSAPPAPIAEAPPRTAATLTPAATATPTATAAPAATAKEQPLDLTALLTADDHALSGCVRLQARCPKHENVELVVDQDGRLHLLAKHPEGKDAGVLRDAMLDLMAARVWANEHRQLIALTQRQLRLDMDTQPQLHLFTPRADWATGLITRLGNALKLHLLAKVTVGNQATWFTTALN